MKQQKSQNAVKALLSEYERTVSELMRVIESFSSVQLTTIVDDKTNNPDCSSVQTILTHVVNSGYAYCVYIRKLKNLDLERPERVDRPSIVAYIQDLNNVIIYTQKTFVNITDDELEIFDDSKKMLTRWGQLYDIEQLMEHAIVHIMRHRRQIERFIILLNNK